MIIPAFNEELLIANLLHSVDVAAGRYGGPVRVVSFNARPVITARIAEALRPARLTRPVGPSEA